MNTIEKYKFQFNPLRIKVDDPEVVVAVEVSGTFDGRQRLDLDLNAFLS